MKKNIENIYVSIDGTEDDNDEVRGKGSWKNAIDFLHKVIPLKSPSKKVGVTMVLTQKSIRHLKEFMEYFNNLNIDVISFNLLDIVGSAALYKDELFLNEEILLSSLEIISSLAPKFSYKTVINSGSTIVDKYLRNKTGYIQETSQKACDALYGSAYCDMNGYFYPCRTYCGKGIDLKNKVDWGKEYMIFAPFLERLFCSAEEVICPLKMHTESSLDDFAKQKLAEINPPNFQIKQTIIFNNFNNRYFVIFCKTNEYVEYTEEGYMIYKMLYDHMSTSEIASSLNYNIDDVWNFLDSEYIKNRIEYTGF